MYNIEKLLLALIKIMEHPTFVRVDEIWFQSLFLIKSLVARGDNQHADNYYQTLNPLCYETQKLVLSSLLFLNHVTLFFHLLTCYSLIFIFFKNVHKLSHTLISFVFFYPLFQPFSESQRWNLQIRVSGFLYQTLYFTTLHVYNLWSNEFIEAGL